jgi:hypothetical protein
MPTTPARVDHDFSHGARQLADAIDCARQIMLYAPWVVNSPDPRQEMAAAERQLQHQLSAALDQGFAFHDPLHPELRLMDQHGQFGLFNPDNLYRLAAISTPGTYVIRGTRGTSADLQIQVGAGGPGIGDGINLIPIAELALDQLVVADDGTFEIVISENPPDDNGLSNTLGPLGANTVLIRESLMDWETEQGGSWFIERTDTRGTPSPLPTPELVDEQYARAAASLVTSTHGWINFVSDILGRAPRNVLTPPRMAQFGLPGQWSSSGVFPLEPNKAVVVTLARSEARYQSIQIGDLWFNALDYCHRQTSLNIAQTRPSSDGAYRLVISAEDPGVTNWLDTGGASTVFAFLRWQGHPAADDDDFPTADVPTAKVVDVREILDEFPDDEPRLSPQERADQLAARRASALRSPRGFR